METNTIPDLLKYSSEFLEKLIAGNLNMEKNIFGKEEEIKKLKANNLEQSKNIYKNIGARKLEYVDSVMGTYSIYTQNMFATQILIEVYTVRQNDITSKYKQQIEMDKQIYDEYTAIPYHDVESKISQLNIMINHLKEEVGQTRQKTKVLYRSAEKECKEIMQEIEKFNICHEEQRVELQRLKDFNWEDPIQSRSCDEKIAKIQEEITELETEIKTTT